MPIPCPHFKITIVKRSHGQSAVAGAAYQSGERLFSEFDQKTKFYNKKKELVHAEIMLPSHAPPGFADRATLWNAVEAVENQWNSQLARRIVLAFPVKVLKEQYLSMKSSSSGAFGTDGAAGSLAVCTADRCLCTADRRRKNARQDSRRRPGSHCIFLNATNRAGFGLSFAQSHAKWKIACIATAFAEYRKHGERIYTDALRVLAEAWEGDIDSLRAEVLQGVTQFVALYDHEYDPIRLIRQLQRTSPVAIYRSGQAMTGPNYQKYMLQILKAYNGSSRTKSLPIKQ